jgi:NADPH2:quinone reductase
MRALTLIRQAGAEPTPAGQTETVSTAVTRAAAARTASGLAAPGRHSGLQLTERPEPRPGPGEVGIDVTTAGIGLIDAFWVSGVMPQVPGFIPGLEVSGTVRELGAGVTGLAPGQPVAAMLFSAGGFAEVVCAPAAHTVPLPEGLSPELAAVVPVNTVTAHMALTTVGRFAAGETLLVHAGTGGLGSQFVQVARALGAARVDAVVGTEEKSALARRLGCGSVWLRSELGQVPAGSYDLVVDPVGGSATEDAFRVLRGGGRLLCVGNASQAEGVPLSSVAHWLENKTTAGFNVGGWLSEHPEQGTASLQWALESVARGLVRVELSRTGGMGEIAELLGALERGETTGKLALRVREG